MITISITGDVCPKDRLKKLISDRAFDSVFGLVKPIICESDLSIANLECALADESDSPIVKCGPNLSCDENMIDALSWTGFNVLTLANNHFADYGEESIKKAFGAMDARGIRYVGAGLNIEEAIKPLIVNVKGKQLAIINCCEHEFSVAEDNRAGCNPLDPISQSEMIQGLRSSVDYIMVVVHGGTEFCQIPSPSMKKLFRFFIDQGADVVVTHHQHCFSGFEKYKGKTIVYGLGNFCFDWRGKRNSNWNEGYIAQFQIMDDGEQELKLIPYVQCNNRAGVIPYDNMVDQKRFEGIISDLNSIIMDDKLLKEEYYSWIDNHEGNTRMALSVYSTRLLRALCNRGILPPYLTKNRVILLYNHINCESHRDRLLHFLRHRIWQLNS